MVLLAQESSPWPLLIVRFILRKVFFLNLLFSFIHSVFTESINVPKH